MFVRFLIEKKTSNYKKHKKLKQQKKERGELRKYL
jgi:hypothetical protein